MKKIGFYGGCFNPPTNAHINLANKAIKKYGLSKLFFVPVGNKYVKDNLVLVKNRKEMLEIAISDYPKMDILDIEINQEKNLKANEVFNMIKSKFNTSKNFFIMGADNFDKIDVWEKSDDLVQNYNYIILERKGFDVKNNIKKSIVLKKYKRNFKILKNKKEDISSSIVRKMIEQGDYKKLEKYLKLSVINYIKEKNLYQNLKKDTCNDVRTIL